MSRGFFISLCVGVFLVAAAAVASADEYDDQPLTDLDACIADGECTPMPMLWLDIDVREHVRNIIREC